MKDAQNPYRTGVLIDNHVEDRFGQELAQNYVRTERIKAQKPYTTPLSEQQAKYCPESSVLALEFQPKT